MEVTDGYFNKITYLEEKVAEHDSNLATSSKLTMFNQERLMSMFQQPYLCMVYLCNLLNHILRGPIPLRIWWSKMGTILFHAFKRCQNVARSQSQM